MTKLIGKVLWFDQRDGQGVIKTEDGTSYYTDISALITHIKSGDLVKFEINKLITDIRCAHQVELI